MTRINYLRKFGDQEKPKPQTQAVHHYNQVARERRKGWEVMESKATEITNHPTCSPRRF
jgi:hypothetical protein